MVQIRADNLEWSIISISSLWPLAVHMLSYLSIAPVWGILCGFFASRLRREAVGMLIPVRTGSNHLRLISRFARFSFMIDLSWAFAPRIRVKWSTMPIGPRRGVQKDLMRLVYFWH
jgi:hypothetical protein